MPRKRDLDVQMYADKWYLDKFDRHECCGCAMVHDVEYRIENARIFTRWKPNERETKRNREKLGIKVSRKKA